ncbi:MAG TPA: PHP domain-containing protein [Candidatus Saccharimonadales bacterium]|nr:PHP domain-containing protein [Candidatus Saccharimonadales bacterium]
MDLHTHSAASPDGGITAVQYRRMLADGRLDVVAVTDHNRVDFALGLRAELGARVIVGEEITAREGEIIGLYLESAVPAGLSAQETVRRIKQQHGLVYIPHPFETVRKGLDVATLEAIAADVDIIETRNGRAVFQNRSAAAGVWAAKHAVPGAASSDAHGAVGWGKTYSVLAAAPTHATLVTLLYDAQLAASPPGLRGVLYPKLNRLRKKIGHAARRDEHV